MTSSSSTPAARRRGCTERLSTAAPPRCGSVSPDLRGAGRDEDRREGAPLRRCPGCGLEMPRGKGAYGGYFHVSPECGSVFTEVLEAEYGNPALFGQVHRLTVDTYAVQHAGGPHPDKSVDVHLVGLHIVLERGVDPALVHPYLQRMVGAVSAWPHFPPPEIRGPLTVFDVAAADPPGKHTSLVREWAEQVWRAWSPHHEAVARLAAVAFSRPRVAARKKPRGRRERSLRASPAPRRGV
ncbi:MAG: DUF5946 family protein [Planctomycetota bacterium]